MATEYLLFSELPFDFNAELPISLGNGVWLARPDEVQGMLHQPHVLNNLEALLVPAQAAGLGQVHVCLCRKHTSTVDHHTARSDMFLALLAIRMALPVPIKVESAVTVDGGTINNPSPYSIGFATSPAGQQQVSSRTLAEARRINLRLIKLDVRSLQRVRSAVIYFQHSTMGLVQSWQLSTLGLFAALEAIFPQPVQRGSENYGPRLARRIAAFLPPRFQWPTFRSWIVDCYNSLRNPLAHGFHAARFNQSSRRASALTIIRLHEITRLCLLGILGHSNTYLATMLPRECRQPQEQQRIDGQGPAPEFFLASQTRWLG